MTATEDLLFHTIEFQPTFETIGKNRVMRPYIMTRDLNNNIFPLWLEIIGGKAVNSLYEDHLLASMAFGKPMPHQTLQDFKNMQIVEHRGDITRRANMIGVYEQAKSGTLPKGEGGRVVLHKYYDFYTVSAETQQAAYKFALDVFIRRDMAEAYKSCGLDPKPILLELTTGAGLMPSAPDYTKTASTRSIPPSGNHLSASPAPEPPPRNPPRDSGSSAGI